MTVDYLEIDDATNADPARDVRVFTGYVSANPDVKAMFFDHGNLTSTIPTYMEAANLAPERSTRQASTSRRRPSRASRTGSSTWSSTSSSTSRASWRSSSSA